MVNKFNPTEEAAIFSQLAAERDRVAKFSVQATPQLAAAVGQIYRENPQLPPGVVLASAQAGLTQDQINPLSSETALKRNQDPDAVSGKQSKSFFQRNFVDKLKTASRYTFAALEAPAQLFNNAGSQVFGNNPDGVDGWFASTDLGTLIKNDEVAGSGYFLGGDAKGLQAQRVQNFRGKTTGGHAWSWGRGTAGIIFDEGSVAYNLMSGVVDGAVALAIPTVPGAKQLAGAVKVAAEVDTASDIVRGADRVFDILGGKGTKIAASKISGEEYDQLVKAAGLVGGTVDAAEANKFLGTDKWFRVRDKLVEADTVDGVRKLLNDNVYPETLRRLRDAKTAEDVTREMIDILGVPQQGIVRTVMPGTKRFAVSNARRVAVVDNLLGSFENSRLGRISERAFENRPSRSIIDFSSDNPVDVRRTINDMDRWMKASLTDKESRVKFLDQALDALSGPAATPTARRKLYEDFHGLVKKSWIDDGLDENVATAVINGQMIRQSKARGFHASLGSELDDGKFYEGFAKQGGGVVNGSFGGPLLQSELANLTIEMPDIAQVRRLTGRLNKIWSKAPRAEFGTANYIDENIERLSKAGELRVPFAAANYLQEQIFRKVILATGGFGIRNIMEGQISLALSQKPVTSIIRHPFQHMQWSANERLGRKIGRKGVGDITGEVFTEEGAIKAMESYRKASGGAIMAHYQDPTDIYRRGRRTGQVYEIERGKAEVDQIVQAHGDQIGRMNADPVMRQLASGKSDDELIDFIRNTEDGKKWFRDQSDYRTNGVPVFDKTTKKWFGTQSVDLNDEHNLRLLLGNYRQRFDVNVGVHTDLRKTIESGLLPPQRIDAKKMGIDPSMRGQVQDIQIGKRGRVATARIDENDENLVRFFAFKNGESSVELERLLARPDILTDPALAQTLTHEVRVSQKLGKRGFKEDFDSMFDKFFAFVHGKPTAYLEKHPAFKQRYYTWAVDEMITSLSPAELDKMIAGIEKASKLAGVSPSDWVGDKTEIADVVNRLFKPTTPVTGDRWQRMLDLQAEAKNAPMTLGPTVINPALVKEEGILFHGTPTSLSGGKFSDIFSVPSSDSNNLFNRGIYLTDSPDVGVSYTVKGAKNKKSIVDGKPVNKEGFVYKVKIKNTENFIDLRKPAPKLNEILRSQLNDEAIQFLERYSPSFSDEALQNFTSLLNDQSVSGERVFSAYKKLFSGMETGEVDSLMQELTVALQNIADGVIYQGGVRRGGLGQHTAYVVLNEKALTVVDSVSPVVQKTVQGTGKLKGTLTLDEVDEFAKGQALDDLAKMTYDATERNNLTDVARFITPFGQAQLEFFRRIGRIYTVETGGIPLPNLNALRKTQLLVEGGRDADPDGNGRGIFYTDPGTGEWVVDYPFTGPFTHLLTSMISGGPGVRSTLQAPIKGALMGLDVRPGLGPVAQIAVSAFAPDIPQLDAFKAAVLPYGEVDLAGNKGLIGSAADAFTPSWFKKIQSAFIDSPESMTTYGNTYFEVYQALSTTGAYDLKTPAGMDQLYQDAKMQAKALTILRGLGQFLGPSRPTNKFQVETLQGDVMVNVLSQELRTMQLEDYDSAIPRFLDIYGEDVMTYLSGKTKAVYGGLLASKGFGDFERSNEGLFRKFKNVAGYFATGGTDLDWQVYTRQIETGMRERLTPEESLQAAQKYVAYSKYRQVQELVGPYPNADQKAYLRQYREYLGEQYPGFALATFDPNRIKNNIAELTLAVQEPSLANNNVAKAAKLYLDARENVMAEATNRGLSSIDRSKNASDLRGYLRQYAEVLKKDYPEFSRLYDRILIDEVDE